MYYVKKAVERWQEWVWTKIIVPVADKFKLDCEYCWFLRGVMLGSILTSIVYIMVLGVMR